MKRYIFIVAAVAIATISCSRTYDVTPVSESQIGFGSWTEHLTKRAQGGNTFVSGDDFAVYGSKVNGSTTNTVFDDVVVTYDGSAWDYVTASVPARFWDPSATSYTFYAISPASVGTAATVAPQTGVVTTSASITFAGNDSDVLVANEKLVVKTGSPAAYPTTDVEIKFNHIASLVDFKVKKHADLGNSTVAVSAFSISNIDNTGTFAVSDYADAAPYGPVVAWTATARDSYDNGDGLTPVTLPIANVGTTGDFLINNLIVMPQSFRTDSNIQTVNIEYTITDEASNVSTYDTSFNLKLFDNVDDKDNADTIITSWEPGKHYTFYITINANKINFTGAITPWTVADAGYNYLIN